MLPSLSEKQKSGVRLLQAKQMFFRCGKLYSKLEGIRQPNAPADTVLAYTSVRDWENTRGARTWK